MLPSSATGGPGPGAGAAPGRGEMEEDSGRGGAAGGPGPPPARRAESPGRADGAPPPAYVHPDILAIIVGQLAALTDSYASAVLVAGVSREWRTAVRRWAKANVRTVRLPADAQEGHLVLLSRACPMLRRLNMDGAERAATPRTMRWTVKRMKDLEEFTAGHCYHIKDGARELPRHCRSLRVLDLRYCFSVPGGTLAEIARSCGNLREVDVSGVDCVARKDLLSIAANLAGLRSLRMNGCDGVTDEGIVPVLESCRELEVLEVRGCWGVRERACAAMAAAASLAELELSFCPGVSAEGLWAIALGACPLRRLRVAGCAQVSEASVLSVAANQARLEELDASGCANAVTDEVLATAGERLRRLRTAGFNGCTQLTDRGLRALSRLARLESLSLRGCPRIGARGVAALSGLPLRACDLTGCAAEARDEARAALAGVESLRVGDQQ